LARIVAPEDRARAFGKVITVLSASPVIAVVVGGPLVDSFGWRPMFIGQAAIASVAVVAAVPLLPETPRRPNVRFDVAGAMALTVAVVGLLFALNRVGDWGLDHRAVQTTIALGVVGLVAFGFVERRAAEPLLRPSWLVRRDVGAPVAANMLLHITLMGLSTTGAFMLNRVFGYGTGGVALLSGIRPAAFSVAAGLSSRHARTIGTRWVLLSGNFVLVAGCALTAVGVQQRSITMVVISIVLTGFGVGYGRPGLITAITNAVDEGDAGAANGVMSMAAQLGSSIGQTLMIAIIGTSAASGAFANAAWAAAGFATLAIVMSALIVYRDAAT
jgi:MFS family permease